jgi:hypothetical protein
VEFTPLEFTPLVQVNDFQKVPSVYRAATGGKAAKNCSLILRNRKWQLQCAKTNSFTLYFLNNAQHESRQFRGFEPHPKAKYKDSVTFYDEVNVEKRSFQKIINHHR